MNEDWQAVANAINARMKELPISQVDLAERSGVSVATLREIQRAKAARKRAPHLLSAISTALGWPENYLRAILTGASLPGGGRAGGVSSDDVAVVLARIDQLHGEMRRLADAVDRLAEDRHD